MVACVVLAALVRAPEWIVAGPWGTPAALSLGGVSCEADLRPHAGDRYMRVSFDNVRQEMWRTISRDQSCGYVVQTNCSGFAWTEGSAYAALWVVSPDARMTRLRFSTSGHDVVCWLNGAAREIREKRHASVRKTVETATTDQGNEFAVEVTSGGLSAAFDLPLAKGPNCLLLKFYTRQPKGTDLVFDASFDTAGELQFAAANPTVDSVRHAQIMQLNTEVGVDAVANLPYAGDAISLTTKASYPAVRKRKPRKGVPPPPEPVRFAPFAATCEQVVSDIDGREIARRSFAMTFPGTNTVVFGTAPARGFYQIRTTVYDEKGRVLAILKPDGFSVIGGTKARQARQAQGLNKVCSCFYWMNMKKGHVHCCENFFPWMKRIGFLHNVGGDIANEDLLAQAQAEGLSLTADFLDPWCSVKREKKVAAAATAARYTRYFKGWNEVDISRFRFKSSTTNWVKRVKSESEAVHAARADGIYTGPTLVRVAGNPWFAECLKLGWADAIDVWDVHAYPRDAPRLEDRHVTNSGNESGAGVEAAVMAALGKSNDKKFIMGEWGARSSHGRNARLWQASMVTKMIAWLGSNPNYLQGAFLVPWNHDWGDVGVAHQPAEAAYYTAAALLDGLPYTRFTDGLNPKDFEAGRFGETLVVWSHGKGACTRRLRVPMSGDLVLVDVYGRATPLARDAEGLVTVTFSPAPVYILPAAEFVRLTE